LSVPARSVSGAGGKGECLQVKVTGAREIEKILKELGPTAANRIARSALNRSATPIVRRAKGAGAGGHGRVEACDHTAPEARLRQARNTDRDRKADKPGGAFRGVWIETFVDEQVKAVLAQLPSDGM
jgi:hypothetical protein